MKSKRCFILECLNDETTHGISFYGLPSDFKQQERWLHFINVANSNKEANKYSTTSIQICSSHFQQPCFGTKGKRLKKHSVPSLINGKCISQHLLSPNFDVVPSVQHPLDLWETIINLTNELSCYEDMMSAQSQCLQKQQRQMELQAQQIQEYRRQLHVYQQKDKRHTFAAMKRKAEKQENEQKRIKLESSCTQTETTILEVDKNTSAGAFLHAIQSRLRNPHAKYSDYLKQFAFGLYFRSPHTYKHLRRSLDKTLPHKNTFSNWLKPIKIRPGVIDESLKFLKQEQRDSKYQLHYALMFDEVYIKKRMIYHEGKMVGFVDYGGLAPDPEHDRLAKTALFFLVNQINGNKKLPVAFVLTDGLTQELLSTLIRNVLLALHEADARILTLTFDGLPVNLSAVEDLGAVLDSRLPNFQTWFPHPVSGDKIFVMLDPCHMLKLIRNVWKSVGILYNVTGKKVEWGFLGKLNRLQEDCGLKAANKLSSRHVNFETDKMRTKLCVQTLSNSVSVAIRVCRELGQSGFEDSRDTEDFISVFNRLFDTLNSRVGGKGYGSPLKQSNYMLNTEWILSCIEYLRGLQILVDGELRSILNTKKYTGVKGLLITLTSLLQIMDTIIMNTDEDLQYLPVYKCLQDHIEMYFGSIRERHGRNNNPDIIQLCSAVRDLLCLKIEDLTTGNCCPLENLSTVVSPFHTLKTLCSEDGDPCCDDSDADAEEDFSVFDMDSNVFATNIVVYIAGFVVKKLCTKLKCGICICKLSPSKEEVSSIINTEQYLLIALRNNGGLQVPSSLLVRVCKVAESSVRFWEQKGPKALNKDAIISTCLRESVNEGLVAELDCGSANDRWMEDATLVSSHGMILVRAIASQYVKVRLYHISKTSTLRANPVSNRRICTKAVHFKNN